MSLRSKHHNSDPNDPHPSSYDTIRHDSPCSLPSQETAQKPIDQSSRNDNTPEPDMHVRVGIARLITLVLQVMDVAEDGLENQEDDYGDAEDGVEGADLEEGGSQSACAKNTQEENVGLTSAAPWFAMYTPSPSPMIALK